MAAPVSGAQVFTGEESAAPEEAEPTPPSAPIALEREDDQDERIVTRLSDIFANVPSLADVTVSASEGVVTLGGLVPDTAASARAEAIATGVDGVVTVENLIERDVSIDVGAEAQGLQDRLTGLLRSLPLVGIAVLAGLAIGAFGYMLASFDSLWRRLTPNAFLAELIASALRFVFVLGGVVVALDMIGAGALMGAVLGGAGVIGVALGFAMRDTVENYVASLMLSLRQPFRPNDWVVIDDREGRVVRLTSRATILMTLDGNHLRIPNSTVFKAVILNYTTNPQRRFDFVLGVDADDDVEAARVLGRQVLAGLAFVIDKPAPEARLVDVGDSNVQVRFLGWVDQRESDWHRARSRAIVEVKSALEGAGFGLPEPIYRLRFDQRTEPLPLQSTRRAEPEGQAPAPSAPAPVPVPAASHAEDLGPQDEIARMVEEERATTPADNDLLDTSRPVE
ncbi:mechanosensitive ion channel family protein [Aurantiacibacter suaedae]|uniref:mechanosensitive ion channel family protein n=1 Tax=Aurantiacibacter suaedae TaxID=2545755 RepID=UPI0010F68244|nr:mechanosensitive ion channel family protein [Aurantiacibacter suaedae]